jgi:hypothetical protein
MVAFLPAAPLSPRSFHKSHEIWHKGQQAVKDRADCPEAPGSPNYTDVYSPPFGGALGAMHQKAF